MNTGKLEAFIFDKMSLTRLPGLSIALVRDGEVVYARGFGQANIEHHRAATPQTLYGAASITKSFIAIAILQLIERGLIKLADPVEKFLPCPIKSTDGVVTIEHLLTHTSGLPAIGYIEAVLRHAHGIGGANLAIASPRDVMTFAQGSQSWAESPAGQRWFYLNEGYVLLGEIVGKIAGTPYERYVHERIFTPLGMTSSFFAEADVARREDVAVPYVLPKDGVAPPRAGRYLYNVLGADAALITNVIDLASYLKMFLAHGRGVMEKKSFEAMTKPRAVLPGEPMPEIWGEQGGSPQKSAPQNCTPQARPSHYGLGLTIADDFLGEPLIGHSGSLIVTSSYMGFMPKSNVGVAVLSNGNGYSAPAIAKVALAILVGLEPRELAFVRTENLLKELSGQYETFRGTLRGKVVREGDFLRIEYVGGDQPPGGAILVPERLDGNEPRFFTICDGARLPAVFRRKEDGGVELIFERYKLRRTGPLPT
jgi:CubicO group peptidase (beta-lactamase class C family)